MSTGEHLNDQHPWISMKDNTFLHCTQHTVTHCKLKHHSAGLCTVQKRAWCPSSLFLSLPLTFTLSLPLSYKKFRKKLSCALCQGKVLSAMCSQEPAFPCKTTKENKKKKTVLVLPGLVAVVLLVPSPICQQVSLLTWWRAVTASSGQIEYKKVVDSVYSK